MSASQMRKMLEQLMGPQDEQAASRHFTDRDVCRSFLHNICLNELFTNTREDLGACGKIHSMALRAEYEKESLKKDYRIEEEVLEYLNDFIAKNERKIESNKKRLEAEESPELESKAQEMHELGIQIGEKLARAETLGNEGKVDESLAMMTEVENLKRRRKDAEDNYRSHIPVGSNQQQKLRACDVCGAMLSLYDNDRRLADHFGGKLHLGFVQIRERVDDLEERIAAKREKRRNERDKEKEPDSSVQRSTRSRSGSRDCSGSRDGQRPLRRHSPSRSSERTRRKRSQSREKPRRSRSRSRDRSRRNRSRSRDRSRKSRSKSRDRSKKARSRSRDRSKKSRSRSRDRSKKARSRSRDRSKKARSRSRDRSRKSRSKSRDRSKKARSRSRDRSKKSRSRSRERSRSDGKRRRRSRS